MSKPKVIKLTRAQHNKLFKYRQVKVLTYYEITDDPDKVDLEMHQYIRFSFRVIVAVLSPLAILFGGVPAMISLFKECWSGKSVGADTINRDWFYKALNGEVQVGDNHEQ